MFESLLHNMSHSLASRCDTGRGASLSCEQFPAICGDLSALGGDMDYCPEVQYVADANEMQQWALDNDKNFWWADCWLLTAGLWSLGAVLVLCWCTLTSLWSGQ